MKQHLRKLITDSISELLQQKGLPLPQGYTVQIERTRDASHGDFFSNAAMMLAKQLGQKPRELAAEIVDRLAVSEFVDNSEIAGPGFINFFLSQKAHLQLIPDIINAGDSFGQCDHGKGETILIEYVSANPTGPLHIGHGRGAAYGASLANLLNTVGYDTKQEYYVNDAGRQMDILAISVWLRYLNLCGQQLPFPEKAYQGDYVREIAAKIHQQHHDDFVIPLDELSGVDWQQHDVEVQLDKLIATAKQQLGDAGFRTIFNAGLNRILSDIREDLQEFGVSYDNWFSEQSLTEDNFVNNCIKRLQDSGHVYEKDKALWFRSSEYGDEKDRVVVRDNGQKTYFASDIAYHVNKFKRGFSKTIDIWGADHHGYIARVKAALIALGENPDALDVLLVQFANLYRGKEKLPMSTRSGEFVTLRELRQEVGNDAARFFYVTRKSEQHLDFDLELAKSHSNDNPVYYIQYAHARICSVLKKMQQRHYRYEQEQALQYLNLLTEPHEKALLATLSRYPEMILKAAEDYEPHLICFYLRDLANDFHSYYNTHHFLIEDSRLRQARISLILACKQVFCNGLKILGVSAPEEM